MWQFEGWASESPLCTFQISHYKNFEIGLKPFLQLKAAFHIYTNDNSMTFEIDLGNNKWKCTNVSMKLY